MMLVIETGQPTEVNLKELPDGVPFKFTKGEKYNTYIKVNDSLICLNTGELNLKTDEPELLKQDCIVQRYNDIKVITKPTTKSVEINKVKFTEINPGECCILNDEIFMNTNARHNDIYGILFNLKTKKFRFISYKSDNQGQVLNAPFVCLELI